jgi:hypothetical protein
VHRLATDPEFAKVRVFKVDFDSSQELLRRWKVKAQSTLIAFKGRPKSSDQGARRSPVRSARSSWPPRASDAASRARLVGPGHDVGPTHTGGLLVAQREATDLEQRTELSVEVGRDHPRDAAGGAAQKAGRRPGGTCRRWRRGLPAATLARPPESPRRGRAPRPALGGARRSRSSHHGRRGGRRP